MKKFATPEILVEELELVDVISTSDCTMHCESHDCDDLGLG